MSRSKARPKAQTAAAEPGVASSDLPHPRRGDHAQRVRPHRDPGASAGQPRVRLADRAARAVRRGARQGAALPDRRLALARAARGPGRRRLGRPGRAGRARRGSGAARGAGRGCPRAGRSPSTWRASSSSTGGGRPSRREAVRLGADDVPDMLALVARTRPGPFLPRTVELGTYLGIRREGRLIAMAGERLHPPGWTEISAVCTDAAFRGQGLGSRLVRAVALGIRERGETPFLHTAATNTAAIRLYESLGFRHPPHDPVPRGPGAGAERRIAGARHPTPALPRPAPTPRGPEAPTPRRPDAPTPRRPDAPTPRRPDAPTPRPGGPAIPAVARSGGQAVSRRRGSSPISDPAPSRPGA